MKWRLHWPLSAAFHPSSRSDQALRCIRFDTPRPDEVRRCQSRRQRLTTRR
jgi:hypothetical protein